MELAFTGPLSPYASAAVYVGVHEAETFEIEEARISLDRWLPGGLGVTAGRYLQDVGQLNPRHAHACPFVERPLAHAAFFGPDGIVDAGLRLDWIAPLDAVTVRTSLGVIRGDAFLDDHHHDDEAEEDPAELEAAPDPGLTGRVELFLEAGRNVAVSIGGSALRGHHDPAEGADVTWLGADARARWDLGASRELVLNAELLRGALGGTAEAEAADPWGWFASADLRVDRHWSVGGFAESTTARHDDRATTSRFGGFVGYALFEESTVFRLVGRSTEPDGADATMDAIAQLVFGLGPHQPHRY